MKRRFPAQGPRHAVDDFRWKKLDKKRSDAWREPAHQNGLTTTRITMPIMRIVGTSLIIL